MPHQPHPSYRCALDRSFFDRPVLEAAPDLLGRVLVHTGPEGTIELRLTEVEAYAGLQDPGSHAFRGRTERNAVMFGPPGHAYVYFTYGMWHCLNLVCGPEDTPSAVLLRAGEIIVGADLARTRRAGARKDSELAQGPARLATALGVDRAHNGADVCPASGCSSAASSCSSAASGCSSAASGCSSAASGCSSAASGSEPAFRILHGTPPAPGTVRSGPRTGVGGDGAAAPWRFWIDADPTVSPYRAHVPRRRNGTSTAR
ncbi:DNA-3-methyladenine glycosylase [Wenjunlia tyrosinilytica]|nr:DNA-3-methyladenine glycosylase [Wenjunlia tyrosinilytica]